MSKRKGFLVMEDLGDVQRSQREKKLQIPKPDAGGTERSWLAGTNSHQPWYVAPGDYLWCAIRPTQFGRKVS